MPLKYRIGVYNAISAKGLERFPGAHYIVGKALATPDAIVLRSHELKVAEIPASVKAVGRAGTGVNNIPVSALSQRGVPVFNAHYGTSNGKYSIKIDRMLTGAQAGWLGDTHVG